GSWDSFGGPLRSACRDAGHADVRFNLVGFRLVAGPPSDRAGTARGGAVAAERNRQASSRRKRRPSR
ncbi:MAG: hypothetical protein AAGA68_27380, partial [Pseudomonadota bacterium]